MPQPGDPPAVSSSRFSRPTFQYGLALIAVAAATLGRFPLEPFLLGRPPYARYSLAILRAAWHGRVGPTLLATALSLVSAWLLFVPRHEAGYPATIVLFLAVSGAMALLAD